MRTCRTPVTPRSETKDFITLDRRKHDFHILSELLALVSVKLYRSSIEVDQGDC